MAYIVVITFDDETEAVKARQSLREAQKHGYLELGDAVTVVKQQIEAFVKYPPRQKPAAFNLDVVLQQLEEASSSKSH